MMSWSPLETSTNGFMDDQTAKELSLREKKQLQWSKEKADQQEWFPFGKPGAGAPLKPSRVRKNSSSSTSNTMTNNGTQSLHQQKNGVHVDHFDQKTTITSLSGSNGHHQPSSKIVQMQYSSTPTNGNNNIPYGYVPSIPTQPSYLPYYQAFPGAIAVPLHTNGFVGSPVAPVMASAAGHLTQLPPTQNYQNSSSPYYALPSGYSPQAVIIHQNHSFGVPNANGLPPHLSSSDNSYGPAGPQPAAQDVNGRGSMTASTLTEASCQPAKVNNSHETTKSELSYTEQWANQLQMWQQMDQHQQQPATDSARPNTLPLYQSSIDNNPAQAMAALPSTSVSVPAPPMASSLVINNSPDTHHFVPTVMSTPIQMQANGTTPGQSSAPTAWVTPMNHAHRTAIVSPLHSKAASLCGNDDMMSSSFSGALPNNKSNSFYDDSGIHKRRHVITDVKDMQELEEKQQKIVETKMAIEEQIAEKRRQQILDAEKERQEIERLERERRLLELRENRENEHERNKWKELMEEEQRREGSVREALEKARIEAKLNRKAKLLQHAWSGRRSDSEELDSPPYSQLVHPNGPTVASAVPVAALTIISVNSGSSGSLASAQQAQQRPPRSPPPASVVGSSLETSRSQSLPPVQHNGAAATDNRPIKPLTVDPLKLWEQISKEQQNEIDEAQERVPRREAPFRQSLRKSRSTEASRLAAAKRSESLERKEKSQAPETTPKSAAIPTSTIPKRILRPKEPEMDRRSELPGPEGRLASAATYIVRRDIFAPVDSANMTTNNGVPAEDKPPVPARRDKERKKSKSKDSSHKEVGGEFSDAAQDRQKLLQRRSSADRVILKNSEENGESDNPWGDQLGGLNPLLQPISTRSRKKSQKLSVSSVPDSPVTSNQPTNNDVVAAQKDISDSMSDLLISSTSDSGKGEVKSSNETLSMSKPSAATGRNANMERFNFRSPLYSSFNVKIKQPNDSQSDVLKQLCRLKEQLKKSQKDVEDTLRLKTPFLTSGKN